MKDKKDKPLFDPDLWKQNKAKNPDVLPESWGKLGIPEKPQAKVSYDPASGRFTLEGSDAEKSRGESKSGESNLGCTILFLILWTAWTIYVVWPIVVSFTGMGYQLVLKLTWILLAWVAPIVLSFMVGRSE
jgi:hypothetical protein